jgi:hypothetical protein
MSRWLAAMIMMGTKLLLENYLIHTYGHQMNTKVEAPVQGLNIEHLGDVPASIRYLKKP